MHRALESEDIIYAVLEHVKYSSTDLLNIAMTCSRFAGPVLDILWSEQSSLVPLIMCLPQDAWEVENQTINFSREPAPKPSAVSLHPKLSVSGLVLRKLFEQFPPATLFPNLFVFDSYALRESRSDLSLVRKFMSPGLETLVLDISAHFPTHEVEQFLCALPIEAHGLRQLSISMVAWPLQFLRAITNIQQARCLNTLMLSLHGTSYVSGVMALELSSLEHLVLSGDVLPQCTHFIRQITTRQLSVVLIDYFQPASPIEITMFMESLSISCPPSREETHEFFLSIKQSDGAFLVAHHAEVDVRGTYCLLVTAHLQIMPTLELLEGSYFSPEPEGPPTLLDSPRPPLGVQKPSLQRPSLNFKTLLRWLVQMQGSEIELGGFKSCTNKLASLVRIAMMITTHQEEEAWGDIDDGQHSAGGLRDKPPKFIPYAVLSSRTILGSA
ncbi:hypothetical protein EDD22DRAFT_996804 [Suillus occidentalis]|nr:hypothetical protein EDD22DRAFT_996804 [Suillus occidentalis]